MSNLKILKVIQEMSQIENYDGALDWEKEFNAALPIEDLNEIIFSLADLDIEVKATLLCFIAVAGYGEIKNEVLKLIDCEISEVKLEVAVALGALGDPRGVEIGIELLEKTNAQILNDQYPDLELSWIPEIFRKYNIKGAEEIIKRYELFKSASKN